MTTSFYLYIESKNNRKLPARAFHEPPEGTGHAASVYGMWPGHVEASVTYAAGESVSCPQISAVSPFLEDCSSAVSISTLGGMWFFRAYLHSWRIVVLQGLFLV